MQWSRQSARPTRFPPAEFAGPLLAGLAALAVSWGVLVFVPALGTFLISDLLGGPDSQLIGNVIERQFKAANNWPLGAALSFLLMYLTFAALAARAFLADRDL